MTAAAGAVEALRDQVEHQLALEPRLRLSPDVLAWVVVEARADLPDPELGEVVRAVRDAVDEIRESAMTRKVA